MYKVYVLSSIVARKSYVGMTDNVDRRLSEHNQGQSVYSSRYRPWKLVYQEVCGTLQEARKRERYLKSCAGRKFLKKIFNNCGIV